MAVTDAGKRTRVVHLTSVHARTDSRVFNKQCRSLAKAGYEVTLVVADGLGNAEFEQGLTIVDVGRPTGRLDRMMNSTRRVFDRAVQLDADLYQFHDPELLPVGLRLKRLGKRVIFDSHEDVPKQILGKTYLAAPVRYVIAGAFSRYEAWTVRKLDAVIGATPSITAKFQPLARRAVNVNNYPLLDELRNDTGWGGKRREVCYVGGISRERGILPLIEALSQTTTGATLNLIGEFSEPEVEAEAKALPGWEKVNAFGFLDRGRVRDILAVSVAGVVTMEPLPNHIDAQPNKMFEYMSAGIPVIASDFPLWREIIEGAGCGLCVDPVDPEAVAAAIDKLVNNPAMAEEMGRNGRKAVDERYNWVAEESVLFALYQSVLAQA